MYHALEEIKKLLKEVLEKLAITKIININEVKDRNPARHLELHWNIFRMETRQRRRFWWAVLTACQKRL